MMSERNLIAIVSIIGFAVVAFTPIVPLLLTNYGISNIYADRAVVGLLSLLCSWGFVWAFFNKEKEEKKAKDGSLHFRPILAIVGMAIIIVGWFTNVPIWMSGMAGLDTYSTMGNDTMEGGIGARVFTSLFTCLGVLCIKYSTFRDESRQPSGDETRYESLLNGGGGGW